MPLPRRTYATRNREFLKFASQGAGLGYIRNCVLDASYFPEIPVEEGASTTKRIARKGQLLARITSGPDMDKYGPYGASQVNGARLTGDTYIIVDDATVFYPGQVITITGAAADRTISTIDYSTNRINLTAALGGAVSDNAAVIDTGDLGTVAAGDMVVCADEIDLSYSDKAVGGYFLNCVFNPAGLIGYAGNETAVRAAMPTCMFDE